MALMTHCPQVLPQQVYEEPVHVFQDFFHPQVVQVVQPVQIIRRHHVVPVPQFVNSYSVKDVCCISSLRRKRRR